VKVRIGDAVEIDAGVVGQDPVLSGRFQRGDESAASQPPSGVAARFDQMPAIFKDGMTGNPNPDIRTRTDRPGGQNRRSAGFPDAC
jgi:hypothetical protein